MSDYNGDLADVVRRQYDSFRDRVPLKGKRVVLKPNLVEYHRDKVINTHPHVVAAAIELCRREGAAEVIVAEGPGHWRNAEYLVAASGLGDVLRHYKVPFIDLNHDEPVKRPNLGRLTGLSHLYLSRTIDSADVVVSLPKLKTHHWAVATLSLKNLFGTLPGICYGWPKNELHWRGIDNSIVDVALTRTPELAIVDGIVGMEGDGPLNGTPKHTGVLVMGCDLVAVDATCCRLMQLDPEKVGYLAMGRARSWDCWRRDRFSSRARRLLRCRSRSRRWSTSVPSGRAAPPEPSRERWGGRRGHPGKEPLEPHLAGVIDSVPASTRRKSWWWKKVSHMARCNLPPGPCSSPIGSRTESRNALCQRAAQGSEGLLDRRAAQASVAVGAARPHEQLGHFRPVRAVTLGRHQDQATRCPRQQRAVHLLRRGPARAPAGSTRPGACRHPGRPRSDPGAQLIGPLLEELAGQ